MSKGLPRRELLVAMCPPGRVRVDVGADHGYVARALGAFATERAPHRIAGRDPLPWIVADGLKPFRHVDVAIIAGMGANTIARILQAGPRPGAAVLHAQDDPVALRLWLADHGWRIEEERLAREAGRFAEVIRVSPGQETATGYPLCFGPLLLRGEDPLLQEHLTELWRWHRGLAERTAVSAPDKSLEFAARARFLEDQHQARGWGPISREEPKKGL
jgi:tRNA A22 N-methylase